MHAIRPPRAATPCTKTALRLPFSRMGSRTIGYEAAANGNVCGPRPEGDDSEDVRLSLAPGVGVASIVLSSVGMGKHADIHG